MAARKVRLLTPCKAIIPICLIIFINLPPENICAEVCRGQVGMSSGSIQLSVLLELSVLRCSRDVITWDACREHLFEGMVVFVLIN